jgi:ABC-2 type transport system permease protein
MKLDNLKAITRKEYFHLIRDFRSLYLAFIIPALLLFLFGYALSLDVNDIRTAVLDYDQTEFSRDLIRELDSSAYFEIIAHLHSDREVTEYLDHGKAVMVVIIPTRWSQDLHADRDAPIQVLFDGSDPNFAGISQGYMRGFIETYNRKRLQQFLNRMGIEQIKPPAEGRIRVWFNEDLESRNFIVPGVIAVIIMIVGAMLTSLVIAREYENGTMETLLSLPIRGTELLLGKAIPYFIIGLTDVLIAVLMGQVLFGIIIKSSYWLMVLASSLYLLVALSLGLMISIAAKSQLVSNQMAILITYLPSLLLSNFVFPVQNMPKILQAISYGIPATYYIKILKGLFLQGIGLEYLWPSFAALFLMFIFLSTLTALLLKKGGM